MTAARAGDPGAIAVLERAGTYLGIGIANVVLTIGPERVVVGGGVGEAGDLIIEPARRELARRVTMMPLDSIEVVAAELGTHAGAVGAALWGALARPGSSALSPCIESVSNPATERAMHAER